MSWYVPVDVDVSGYWGLWTTRRELIRCNGRNASCVWGEHERLCLDVFCWECMPPTSERRLLAHATLLLGTDVRYWWVLLLS